MAIMTPKFRVSYPALVKPKLNKLNGKEEFSVVALFDKGADLSALKAEVNRVIKEKYGDKVPANLRSPFRNQGEKATEQNGKKVLPQGYTDGAIFINLKSSRRPGIVDQNMNEIISEADLYAGCYARATVTAYVYDNAGNRGVALGLNNVQKVAEGESLTGRTTAQDDFAPVEITSSDKGSTATNLFT